MVRYVVVLAVTFLACGTTSPHPTQYAQGAPRPAPAPSFNPMTDSPITVGQPRYVGPLEGIKEATDFVGKMCDDSFDISRGEPSMFLKKIELHWYGTFDKVQVK